MCKAASEGGQRCYSHARQSFDAAQSRLTAVLADVQAEPDLRRHAQERYHRRILDLASTEQGRVDVERMMEEAMDRAARLAWHPVHKRGALEDVDYFRQVLVQGQDLQERNAAMAELARAERDQADLRATSRSPSRPLLDRIMRRPLP